MDATTQMVSEAFQYVLLFVVTVNHYFYTSTIIEMITIFNFRIEQDAISLTKLTKFFIQENMKQLMNIMLKYWKRFLLYHTLSLQCYYM